MKIELCFSENKKNWLKEQTNERVEMYYEAWKAGEISDTDIYIIIINRIF